MKYILPFFVLFFFNYYLTYSQKLSIPQDTNTVQNLNRDAYAIRLTNPEETLNKGQKALALAKKLGYEVGIAEAMRVIGIGYFYQDKPEKAISAYLNSLDRFQKIGNEEGQAKVYNNIGNLYRDAEHDKALEYFKKSLELAKKLDIKDLQAGLYLNMGTVYMRKKNIRLGQDNYRKSLALFTDIDEPVGIIHSLQNLGVLYFRTHDYKRAEKFLREANQKAKEKDLNTTVASINLTLTSLLVQTERFTEAEEMLKEGISYSELVNNPRLLQNYTYTYYELEKSRGNFEKALHYLQIVYKQDSTDYSNNISSKVALLQEQYKQREKQREQELIIAKQRNTQLFFWASVIVSVLLLMVVSLLIWSNKRKIQTNKQLKVLNSEISQQKEELDWINQRLEQVIAERTRDLKIKNNKLSKYSWHLSHQIRGPIATMKGLMILEKDKLIDNDEFIKEMGNCLEDIDFKILTINETLADSDQEGFPDNQTNQG